MKNTKNCSVGAKKLQDFYQKVELDDNVINEFLEKTSIKALAVLILTSCTNVLLKREKISLINTRIDLTLISIKPLIYSKIISFISQFWKWVLQREILSQ